jgi:hypothetical protein
MDPTRRVFDHIPGLFLYTNYFAEERREELVRQSLQLYERLGERIIPETTYQKVGIPQPTFVKSAKHNLPGEEFYARLSLLEADGRTIRCEFFPKYGERGHALCYFQGNPNLPDFVTRGLLGEIRKTLKRDRLVEDDRDLKWKLTMNFYKSFDGKIAGFPFHVDIPSNGVVTMILNVHREVLFQIAREESVEDIELPLGSLLILSGESRYRWKHRVLPKQIADSDETDRVERVSLVLGFQ